jgi:hypothetical protein
LRSQDSPQVWTVGTLRARLKPHRTDTTRGTPEREPSGAVAWQMLILKGY